MKAHVVARWIVLPAVTAMVLTMASPASAKSPPPPAPPHGHGAHHTLTVAPDAALPGATVVVTGKGLGGRKTSVSIAGLPAAVQRSGGNRLVVQVPATAPAGTTTLVVRRPDGRTVGVPFRVLGEHVFDGVADLVTNTPAKVTQPIGPAGGSIHAGAITLDIPPGALLDLVAITVTPLAGLSGTPVDGGFQGGALLEPDGLHFLTPATLTVPVTTGGPPIAAWGAAGNGTNFHLTPSFAGGAALTIPIWHFSAAGAVAVDPSALQQVLGYEPNSAQEQAAQAVAAGILAGDADAVVHAVNLWYTSSVRPGLLVALGALQEFFELAVGEFMAWRGLVASLGDESSYVSLDTEGEKLMLDATADLAGRLLSRCTPTGNVTDMLADILRLAGVTQLDPSLFHLETRTVDGRTLPTAAGLPAGCVHADVESLTHPAVLARAFDNPLTVHAGTVFWNGGSVHDRELRVEIVRTDGAEIVVDSGTTSDGTWETTLSPTQLGSFSRTVRARLTTGAPDNVLTALNDESPVSATVRERLTLTAVPPGGGTEVTALQPVSPGAAMSFVVRLAGPEPGARQLDYSVTGGGTLGATTGTTTGSGLASFSYTTPATPGSTATVTVLFVDGGVTRTAAMTVPVRIAGVTISPRPTSVPYGANRSFAAAVTGVLDAPVTWSATGAGSVSSSGVFTPTALGAASVTAAAGGGSDTVTFTVVPNAAVAISPTTATVAPGATQQFIATVTGAPNTAVTWSATGGTVSTTGLFTAVTGPTGSVTATSVADPTRSATAAVSIVAPSGYVDLSQVRVQLGGTAAVSTDFESTVRDCLLGILNISYSDPLAAGGSDAGSCHTTATTVSDHAQVSGGVTYSVARDGAGHVTGIHASGSFDGSAVGSLAMASGSVGAQFTFFVIGGAHYTFSGAASMQQADTGPCARNAGSTTHITLSGTGGTTSQANNNGTVSLDASGTVSNSSLLNLRFGSNVNTAGGPSDAECAHHIEFELTASFS